MKIALHNQKGEKGGEIELSDKMFKVPLNSDLLHQVILYYERFSRRRIAKVKDRSEVRGGGKKPWRQKGTGRARHGSIRSPLWRKGGVTFGPTPEKKYQVRIPRRFKRKALFMALSRKLKDGEIIFIDKMQISEPKTRNFTEIFKSLTKVKKDINKKRVVLVLAKKDENLLKAAKNIKKVSLVGANSLNPYLLLKNKYLLIDKKAIEQLAANK